MKIKIITCHDVYNLGASLQAYALQTYLSGLGYDVEIIDYKPDYLSGHFDLWSVSSSCFNRPIVKQLYLLLKLPTRLLALRRKKAFDEFKVQYLRLTRRYNSYEALCATPPKADVYVAGSDQIWNTLFPNGRDKAFYLDFGKRSTKRVSYAASFATAEINAKHKEFVSKELKNIDYISVREKMSLPLLCDLGIDCDVAVCDPVFLFGRNFWLKKIGERCSKVNKEKYLLLYLTDKSPVSERIANEIKKRTNWKIYSVGAIKANYANKCFQNADPFDFVALIRDAQFVISNSFHATAFSIIMERNFCVVKRSEDINVRMESLLADFGLSERLVDRFSFALLDDVDFSSVHKKKEAIVSQSKKWLETVLKG